MNPFHNWTEDNWNVLMIAGAVVAIIGVVIGCITYYNMEEGDNRVIHKQLENERLGMCTDIDVEAERVMCMNGVLGD